MPEAEERHSPQDALPYAFLAAISRGMLVAFQATLLLLIAAYLLYFAAHVWLLLPYPYPLDYGEGPLLAQIELLRSGTPIWQIYRDPAQPPYVVVNYPPLYLLLTAALSGLTGSVLVAGRLISLLSTFGCVVALVMLVRVSRTTDDGRRTMDDGRWTTDNEDVEMRGREARKPRPAASSPHRFIASSSRARWLFLPILFLTIPIVREWGVLVRVDMLGVCLGLWGLVALRQAVGSGLRSTDQLPTPNSQLPIIWAAVAGILFMLSLYVKPSLIAAPAAGCAWLALRVMDNGQWTMDNGQSSIRHTDRLLRSLRLCGEMNVLLIVLAVLALGGGGLFALLQWASDGWFALHVVAANANRWEGELAWQFWRDQLRLRWPLALAAILSVAVLVIPSAQRKTHRAKLLALPVLYVCSGIVTAIGIGKVGAYANYFLELYAGLVWLVALGMHSGVSPIRSGNHGGLPPIVAFPMLVLLIASLCYYPPVWSQTQLRVAGLLEPSPPRLAFGRYNLWEDIRREADVLAAQARVQTALVSEVQDAGPVIFADIPGVATQAGALYRTQVFEQRQLLDQGLWDQRELLLELANGQLPLAVIDFLGNWLTPEMVEIMQRRYAQDGSLGTFDLYRPVDPGPRTPTNLTFGDGLRLTGYRMLEAESWELGDGGWEMGGDQSIFLGYPLRQPPVAAQVDSYESGELLVITLEWQRTAQAPAATSHSPLTVVIELVDRAGNAVVESERPLVYGALPPEDWPVDATIQHMQPLQLPASLPRGTYTLALRLQQPGQEALPPQEFGQIVVGTASGRYFAETEFFVPGPLLRFWSELGGVERAGYPLTPAVPFAWGTLQCFERVCLEMREGMVQQRPLGQRHYMAETIRSTTCGVEDRQAGLQDWGRLALLGPTRQPPQPEICPAFADAWQRFDGATTMGGALSGEMLRYGHVVQWTRYARLERVPDSDDVNLGRLGDDSLRLSPGMRYRWP